MILWIFQGSRYAGVHRERILFALGQVENELDAESNRSLNERFFQPLIHNFASKVAHFAPRGQISQTTAKLEAAGIVQWDSMEWKALQFAFAILIALILFGIFTVLGVASFWRLEMLIIGFIIGYLLPDSWLKTKVRQRRQEIEETLPDILDLLTVSVEAGLGFDAALLKVVEKKTGVLALEFLRILQEIKMGRPRREALRDLSKRNPVEDLGNLIASLVQADQLGISISGVLRNQSKQIRQKRKQRAEERAQKAPVKMMIPLVFFIFPTVFIIVLGPAIIQVMEMLKNQ